MSGMQPSLRRHPCFYHEVIPLASPEITCTDRREAIKNVEDTTETEIRKGRRGERGILREASYALLRTFGASDNSDDRY